MNTLLKKLYENGDIPIGGQAIDIGFGEGGDILFLLEKGFFVTGIEKDEKALQNLSDKILDQKKVALIKQDVRNYAPKDEKFDLIVMNNILPFMSKKETIETISKFTKTLNETGYLLITLFGPEDDWNNNQEMSFFEYEEALKLLTNFGLNPYYKSTEAGYGLTKKGNKKYWHIHRFILRKVTKKI